MSWTPPPPESHNGELVGYNVTCTSESGNIVVTNSVSGTSLTTIGFSNVSLYTCEVCAFTSIGCGPSTFVYLSTYGECKCTVSICSSAKIAAATFKSEMPLIET